MKFGLMVQHYNTSGALAPALTKVAQTAESSGFHSLWVLDHFFQMESAGAVEEPMLEAYTTLAYLAGQTQRLTLGVMVTGVAYRYPAVLVKTVTTLDVLSSGRAWLGLGAAWYEREAHGLGIPFPALKTRFEYLEDTLQIVHKMWHGDHSPYEGIHFKLAEPINSPQPINKPRPPILVGGMGEKKTLRMVAEYADACNFDFPIGIEALEHKLDVLREHCKDVGRDYNTILKTCVGSATTFPLAGLKEYCRTLESIGFQYVIFNVPDPYNLHVIEALGKTLMG